MIQTVMKQSNETFPLEKRRFELGANTKHPIMQRSKLFTQIYTADASNLGSCSLNDKRACDLGRTLSRLYSRNTTPTGNVFQSKVYAIG